MEQADVLIDPFRPGVMERLNLGPEVFLGDSASGIKGVNHKLVYARLVGFSRTGGYSFLRYVNPVVQANKLISQVRTRIWQVGPSAAPGTLLSRADIPSHPGHDLNYLAVSGALSVRLAPSMDPTLVLNSSYSS